MPGAAGDLIVWDPYLPHGPASHHFSRPRVAQYITMIPVDVIPDVEKDRQERIKLVQERRVPEWWRGLVGQLDPEPGPPIELTELGRKLIGFDEW